MVARIVCLGILTVAVAGVASAATPLKPARVAARIPSGMAPCSENAGFGAMWVSNAVDATIARIDPATNKVTGVAKVGKGPCGVVASDDALWIDGYGTSMLERVDPADAAGHRPDPDRPELLGRRVRRGLGLGDERVRRNGRPRRPGDEEDHRHHPRREGAAPGALRARRDLGRRELRQGDLSGRPRDEQGAGGPDRAQPARLRRRLPDRRSGWRRAPTSTPSGSTRAR